MGFHSSGWKFDMKKQILDPGSNRPLGFCITTGGGGEGVGLGEAELAVMLMKYKLNAYLDEIRIKRVLRCWPSNA